MKHSRWLKGILFFAFALLFVPVWTSMAQYDWGVQPEVLGDVNGDKRVTSADAACIMRHVVGMDLIKDVYTKAHADATEDGNINSADATAVLRHVVYLDSMPPGLWTPHPTATPSPKPTATPTPKPTAKPTATPSPTPIPTATPTPTPYLTSENGLVLHRSDPNFSKIYAFYYDTALNKVETNSTNCKDIVGWISMEFTGIRNKSGSSDYAPDYTYANRATYTIDYPIMFRSDLSYYNQHNENGEESDSGSIYSWSNVLTKNIVIDGHNARSSRTRFHHLHSLQNYLICCKNRGVSIPDLTFNISMFGYSKWQIWAMYETEADEPESTYRYNRSFSCNNAVTAWINTQMERSEIDFGVEVTNKDRIMTLITCGDVYESDADAQNKLYIFLKYVGN